MVVNAQGTVRRRSGLRGRGDQSYVAGSQDVALLDMTIGDALANAARTWPAGVAVTSVHQGIRWTWAELHDRAEKVAAGLSALGLKAGDRVAIRAPNCAEWVLVQFATARLGLILVNLHAGCRRSEILHALRVVEVRAIIGFQRGDQGDFVELLEEIAWEITAAEPGALQAEALPSLSHVIKIGGPPRQGWLDFEHVAAGDGSIALPASPGVQSHAPASIQFTSGTTGCVKAATLSHHSLLNNAKAVAMRLGLSQADKLCIPVPLHHCFGMVMGNLCCVLTGATMVYPTALFDAQAVLRCVEAEACTVLYGVPTMFIAALEHPRFGRHDLRSLRTGIMAGAICPPGLVHRVAREMGIDQIAIAYGMTETSPVSFQSQLNDPLPLRRESVGFILPHLEAKVVGPEGSTVDRGEVGELCVRGYSVMLGYWGDEEATAAAVDRDGWMHTQDLAILRADDRLEIVGRKQDMIIRGGENIYPREIEAIISQCPGVVQVSIIGVPDLVYGQEVCAFVQLQPNCTLKGSDIAAFCRLSIANYKVPRYIRIIDDFPLTASGKVKNYVLSAEFTKFN